MSQRNLPPAKRVKSTNPIEKRYWKMGIMGVYFGILFGIINLALGYLQLFKNSDLKQSFPNTAVRAGFNRAANTFKSTSGDNSRLIAKTLHRSRQRLRVSVIDTDTAAKIASLISFAKNQQGPQNILTAELKAYYLLPKNFQSAVYINYADDNNTNVQKLDNLFKTLNLM